MKGLWAFVFLMIFVGLGCGGPGTGKVSGKVTVNGKPLSAGILIINTENKKSLTAGIKDGVYSIDEVPVGKATFAVRESNAPATQADPSKVLDPTKPIPAPPPSVVPKKFENIDTSGLTLSVAKGVNEFNIDLK